MPATKFAETRRLANYRDVPQPIFHSFGGKIIARTRSLECTSSRDARGFVWKRRLRPECLLPARITLGHSRATFEGRPAFAKKMQIVRVTRGERYRAILFSLETYTVFFLVRQKVVRVSFARRGKKFGRCVADIKYDGACSTAGKYDWRASKSSDRFVGAGFLESRPRARDGRTKN